MLEFLKNAVVLNRLIDNQEILYFCFDKSVIITTCLADVDRS